MSVNGSRRDFLVGAGIAAVAAGLDPAAVSAQEAQAPHAAIPLEVVDFHSHFVGPAFTSRAGAAAPAAQKARWDEVNRNLSDPEALLSSIDAAGVSARVVNTPLEFIRGSDGEIPADADRRANDQLAELAGRNAGRLHGLATVDAYGGDAGAQELNRAVRDLGLRGVFVEAARKDLLLDAPEARPTLAEAANLGIPVFVHPISDPQLHGRLARYGALGTSLSRGTINSAALVALLESGTFDELPDLRVVVTTLAIGGVLLAGGLGDGRGLRADTPELNRRHVYIDTMGLSPILVRSAVDLLGADHVLAGTDWPVFVESAVPERLERALASAGLGRAEQELVAQGNALALLGIS